MKNTNKKWISLILAMWLVILISLLAMSILEYIIPFSRNIKWIENSSNAYYQTSWAIEEALWFTSQTPLIDNTWHSLDPNSPVSWTWNIIANWSILPPSWEWNSEYDSNWNIIKSWSPIQLEIWNWLISDWSNVIFQFRVPDLNWNTNNTIQTLAWWENYIINWQLSSPTNTLNADWTLIKYKNIYESNNNCTTLWDCNIKFTKWIYDNWVDLSWLTPTFNTFYNNNCQISKCTLKLSIINKLELTTWTKIPYIEWKWIFDQNNSTWDIIPLRYTQIEASWKSYGFKKDLKVRVPQQTTIEAFDFTIFQ